MKISYAITACNEAVELERLLSFLKDNIREEDEVIIQLDTTYTPEVLEVCNLYTNFNHEGSVTTKEIKNSQFYAFALDKNFAQFKNQLSRFANGDYIFQIDADEVPHLSLIQSLPNILKSNPDNEVYLVPRINTVDGLTPAHVRKWGWNVDFNGYVNFPDFQWRIYKRASHINWINKVHEKLDGFKTYATLPAQPEFCLLHHKSIIKQEQQNNFYDNL